MAGKVEVSPELLRQASVKTANVTDRVKAVLTGLESAIDGLGEPWGGDTYGEKFANGEDGKGYIAARENLKQLTTDNAKKSDDQSTAQNDSSKLHGNTDQASADTFKS
ncbi:WXG100 family type VII secretion target [Nocardia acidivorans]|uniref:WXG100 family type VII secretion target n=1 Tax=Nocardia acidivorans TaxID=404580 RepID=UPI000A870D56|nr:hypothetical protein [Nocardia acidivorans]